MEPQRFEFNVDEQITTWYRTRFSIEASSMEEAVALAKKAFAEGGMEGIQMLDEYCDGDAETRMLDDVVDYTGKAELYSYDDFNLIWSHS
jgi:hypothetical protein